MNRLNGIIKELVKELKAAKVAYYSGKPIITDEYFDFKEKTLRILDPGNKYFQKVCPGCGSELEIRIFKKS